MDGLFRRGGVWYARLVIPRHLRSVLLKTEFVASTGVREPAVARVVAAELLAGWRRRLLDLSRMAAGYMDIEQIAAGHPALLRGGYLSLSEASRVSGIDEPYLLGQAAEGGLALYFRAGGLAGHLCGIEEFDREIAAEGVTLLVPLPGQMSELAIPTKYAGVLRLRDSSQSALRLAGGGSQDYVLFDVPGIPEQFFAPERPVVLSKRDLEVSATEVDRLRSVWASTVTTAQIDLARATKVTPSAQSNAKSRSRVSEAVNAYMTVRSRGCSEEQGRRIRGALDLFVELEGDPLLCEVDNDRLEAFRDKRLVTVPADENKIRLRRGTRTVSESILAVRGTVWPVISAREQVKRLNWISGMFRWLKEKRWIDHDPSLALVKEGAAAADAAKAKQRDQDARDLFTRDELGKIFSSGSWFSTGRGELTAAGTYREFSPHYYWLPLMGLFTGGRINELSQMYLRDSRASRRWSDRVRLEEQGQSDLSNCPRRWPAGGSEDCTADYSRSGRATVGCRHRTGGR